MDVSAIPGALMGSGPLGWWALATTASTLGLFALYVKRVEDSVNKTALLVAAMADGTAAIKAGTEAIRAGTAANEKAAEVNRLTADAMKEFASARRADDIKQAVLMAREPR